MASDLVQIGISVVAVSALVALTWLLGFRQEACLASAEEARELLRLAPGGFEPVAIALDADGKGAIARDAAGGVMVLLPHGNQFVARPVEPRAQLIVDRGQLRGKAGRTFSLNLGDEAAGWTSADITVS